MAQFPVRNDSGVGFQALFLADQTGQPIVVALCTVELAIANTGGLTPAAAQPGPSFAGEYHGEPGRSSLKYEPDVAFTKVATDVVLIGHARPARPGDRSVDVGLKVGPVQKIVRVFGDRYWVKTGGSIIATRPNAFDRIPLVYERAFGGWDKAHKDEARWTFDPRNPVGCGFGDPLRYVEEGRVPLPNVEDPNQPIRRYGEAPPPAGFGFVSPDWQARARYAGTYDAAWDQNRKPLLPQDFDLRFFSAASPGLLAPGFLRGDEDIVVVNAGPVPQLKLRLPGIPPPVAIVTLNSGATLTLATRLDTVVVNTDDMVVRLSWRAHARIAGGPELIGSVDVRTAATSVRAA